MVFGEDANVGGRTILCGDEIVKGEVLQLLAPGHRLFRKCRHRADTPDTLERVDAEACRMGVWITHRLQPLLHRWI